MYDQVTLGLNVDPYIISALKEDITSEDVSTNSVMPNPTPGVVDLICKEDGIIWFIEACDLNVMGIRRALWQMEQAGWFRHVRGFLIGRPYCNGEEFLGLDQYEAVTGILGKYNVPILMDLDIGHIPPAMPLICGSYAKVTSVGNDVEVEMELN